VVIAFMSKMEQWLYHAVLKMGVVGKYTIIIQLIVGLRDLPWIIVAFIFGFSQEVFI